MLIAAVLTIAKIWNQPRCPSMDEWIKKMTNTMEYYSAIKPTEAMLFKTTWLNQENAMSSGVIKHRKTNTT
jgi:hypothetical protein